MEVTVGIADKSRGQTPHVYHILKTHTQKVGSTDPLDSVDPQPLLRIRFARYESTLTAQVCYDYKILKTMHHCLQKDL